MNIVITGSTGFVGRNLVPCLLADGHSILEITRDKGKSFKYFGDSTLKYEFSGDQLELAESILSFQPEACIHLASYLTSADDYQNLQTLLDANIYFLCNLLDALKKTSLKLFINTGTFAEYREGDGNLDPAYLYAATKTASRCFLKYYSKAYDFSHLTIVPYTIYGGNDSQRKIIDFIYESVDNENQIDLSPGTQILDFIHIDDVVSFYTSLINNYAQFNDGDVFHLGTGKGTTLREIAILLEKNTRKKANVNWGGKSFRPTDVLYAVANFNNVSFWSPKISIEKGIELFLESKKRI